MKADDPLDDLSDSALDGEDIDWAEPGAGVDPDVLRGFKDMARIARFSRDLQRSPGPSSSIATPSGPQPWGSLLLLEPLGAGARGEVWRAWDATLQRQVALKFLQTSHPKADGASWSELLAEARALARVRHRGVVTVYGIAEHGGLAGMWMECLEGGTLARELDRSGRMPAQRVAFLGLELCSALEALESAGVVHRDIKPSNIVLEGDGRAVLTDFGLGWRPALDESHAVKSSGTPIFMAPEVLAGGAPSPSSDVYALGVTLWWALAGRVPFESKTLRQLRDEAARGPARRLRELVPDAPEALASAIEWAMSPSDIDRPRSAGALASRLRAATGDLDAHSAGAARSPQVASIAVLPFVNRSASAEDEYFSDGLADELLNVLSKIKGLRVSARASSFRFRGQGTPPADIGRALRVARILDGTVRRIGNRVRISVQLVDVSDGQPLWSETYNRTLEDIFAVQDDIAACVVKELRGTLLGDEAEAVRNVSDEIADAAKGRASVPEAHRLYLIGRHFARRLNRGDMSRGVVYLREAIALDPKFALAWAELGGTLSRAANKNLLPEEGGIEEGRRIVLRALAIEPDLGEAHARLASIQMFHDWNWSEADRSYARALERMPGDVVALTGSGVLAMILGRIEDAIALHSRVVQLDPLSGSAHSNLGLTLLRAGVPQEAETSFRKALELEPERYLTRALLARTLVDLGRGEEALAEAAREPDRGERLYMQAIVHHLLDGRAESDAALHGLIEAFGDSYQFQIAETYALRGEPDQAFAWLERAFERRDAGVSEAQCSINLRSIHGDPRWAQFLQKMGFH